MSRVTFGIAWLPLALACSSAPDPTDPDPPACDATLPAPSSFPALEVLREDVGAPVPVAPDDNLVRHFGAQGGSHFYVYVRAYAADPVTWSVLAELRAEPGATLLAEGSTELASCPGQWTRAQQTTVFIEGEPLVGKLRVQATPSQGAALTFEAPITVGTQPNPPPP